MELILILVIVGLAGAYCVRLIVSTMKPRPAASSCGCGCSGCPTAGDNDSQKGLPDACQTSTLPK